MDEMISNWDDLRLFLAVARAGGLGPAVPKTGKSAPTLGRRMLSLERQLGRELFYRGPKGYALTQAGEHLLEKAEDLEAQVAYVAWRQNSDEARLVSVSAGSWVSAHLCHHSLELLQGSPVRFRLVAQEALANMRHREAAIGIRNFRQQDPALAARKIGQVRFAWYARDADIDVVALPLTKTPSSQWIREQVQSNRVVEVGHPRNALDMALAGSARALLPCFIGDGQPTLQRLGRSIPQLTHAQWLVMHHEDRHLPEVRLMADRIYALLHRTLNTA